LSANEFDDLFGGKKKTPTKREPIPTVSTPVPTQREPIRTQREPIPTAPTPPRRRHKKTPQIDVEKLTKDIVSQVTESLAETIENKLKASPPKPIEGNGVDPEKSYTNIINDLGMKIGSLEAEIRSLEPLKEKMWNEVNRLKWMNSMTRPDKKGFKKVEMERYFGSTVVGWSEVDSIIEDYKKMGLISTGRNGWMRLTQKGKKQYQNLLEVKN
jgi:hypothetical protein